VYPDPFLFICPVYGIILHCFDSKTVSGNQHAVYLAVQIFHLRSLILSAWNLMVVWRDLKTV